jgi:hypothetical protein
MTAAKVERLLEVARPAVLGGGPEPLRRLEAAVGRQ